MIKVSYQVLKKLLSQDVFTGVTTKNVRLKNMLTHLTLFKTITLSEYKYISYLSCNHQRINLPGK